MTLAQLKSLRTNACALRCMLEDDFPLVQSEPHRAMADWIERQITQLVSEAQAEETRLDQDLEAMHREHRERTGNV